MSQLRAAAASDVDAQVELGYRLLTGTKCSADFDEAVLWFERAAQQDDCRAIYNLVLCSCVYRGVSWNPSKCRRWLQQLERRCGSQMSRMGRALER